MRISQAQLNKLLIASLAVIPIVMVFQFIRAYGWNIPFDDDWYWASEYAFLTANRTLTWSDIFRPMGGHWIATSNVTIAALAWIVPWQPIYGAYFNWILGLARFGVIILLFHRDFPRLTYIAVVPIAVLTFALPQHTLWLANVYSTWNYTALFILLTLLTLRFAPVTWVALILASVWAVLAVLSIGAGLTIFPVILVTLWLYGYRRPLHYVYWIVVAGGIIWVFLQQSTADTVNPGINWLMLLPYLIAYCGGVFAQSDNFHFRFFFDIPEANDDLTAVLAGGLLLFIVIWNGYYMVRTLRLDFSRLVTWVSLSGITLATGGLLFIGRYSPERLTVITTRYMIQSLPITYVWVASTLTVVRHLHQIESLNKAERILLTANRVIAVILSLLFIRANIFFLQNVSMYYQRSMYVTEPPFVSEICVYEYPLTRQHECLYGQSFEPGDVYRMAYYGQSVFQDESPRSIMPEDYQTHAPIVIETNLDWANAYFRKWYLAGSPENKLFHIAPTENADHYTRPMRVEELDEPLQDWYAEVSVETEGYLAEFLQDAPTVWFLTNQINPQSGVILEQLGYIPTPFTLREQPERDYLTLNRYKRVPTDLTMYTVMDDVFQLQFWRWQQDFDVLIPCQVMTLESWWSIVDNPDDNYALRLMILDVNGNSISESMSGISTVPTSQWERNQLYLDERSLALPCDLSPEQSYQAVVSIETADRTIRLPITDGVTEATADRAILQDMVSR